jgi:glutamine amidotransferase
MIAILDYEAGNLTSVELAVRHVGGEAKVTRDPAEVADAERVIFPGVGAARSCMENLRRFGVDAALHAAVESGKPILAICIGLQLLFERSEEDGGVACLGLLPGKVVRFAFPPEQHIKVPHMGWNEIRLRGAHPLLAGLPDLGAECYFVHSYYGVASDAANIYADTDYAGTTFVSAAGRGNLFATQFHPEKSGEVGLRLLRNFLSWDGRA